MVNINFNSDELQAKLNSLAGSLTGEQMGRSIALGINRTIKKVRTESDRDIRKVFNLRQQFVLRYIKLVNASSSKFVGDVYFPTKPVPMSEFMGMKGGKRDRRRKGKQKAPAISVEIIKGQRKDIAGGFLFQSQFGGADAKLSIMHRSVSADNNSYSGGAFQFRHKRSSSTGSDLHIGRLNSPSPFGTVMNPIVKKNLKTFTEKYLQERIFETLDKMVQGHIKQANNRGGRYRR